MIHSLILVEGPSVSAETLRMSLRNAKQVIVGYVPARGMVLDLSATTAADHAAALLEFAQAPNVTQVLTLTLRTQR